MKHRSVAAVVLLPFVTFGIYSLYWHVSTKKELNEQGANIPTAWLLIVPIANIFWLWKYYEGAEQVTNKKVNSVLMFIIALLVTSIISSAICQSAFNDLGAAPVAGPAPNPPAPSPTVAAPQGPTPAAPASPEVAGPATSPAPALNPAPGAPVAPTDNQEGQQPPATPTA